MQDIDIAHLEAAISQGMSNALNNSRNGLQIETKIPINSDLVSLLAFDPANNLIEISGKLA